jgi:DNA-binding LytR/AlgR family response regulator
MNILIVEDEHIVAIHLQEVLREFGYQADDVVTNYADAVNILQKKVFHLVMLDINLKGHQTGIDVAEFIGENFKVPFIFLTGHQELAIVNAALKTSPHAFLPKPFDKVTIYSALKLAFKSFREDTREYQEASEDTESTVIKDALFIKEKHLFIKILLADILYIRSDDNYLELHTTKKKFTIRETLKNILAQLPQNSFFRVHKSFIINLNAITAINYVHVMIDKIEIPITAENRADLLSRIRTFS